MCVLARGRPGLGLMTLFALGAALVLPRIWATAGLSMGPRLQVAWLLPFFSCWGLGEGCGLFERLTWWDCVPHALGGAACYALWAAWVGPRRLPPGFNVIAGILASLGVGAAWELGERASDLLLGTRTQLGLSDTMRDLTFDLLGASLMAAALFPWPKVARALTGRTAGLGK
jgi:hypothetical protein